MRPETVAKDIANAASTRDLSKVEEIMGNVKSGVVELTAADPDGYLLPNALDSRDPIHIYFNALGSAIKSSPWWEIYSTKLRGNLKVSGY